MHGQFQGLTSTTAITGVANRWLAPFENTLLHPRLWDLNRHSAAGAVAAGLFCGLIPGPLQMLGAAICAVVFRVNLPLALLTTLYTNPFTIVPLYIAAFAIGQWVLPGSVAFGGSGAPRCIRASVPSLRAASNSARASARVFVLLTWSGW